MRISNGHFGQTMLASMQRASAATAKLTQQMSNSQRVQRPSDDPVASIHLLGLDRDTTLVKQFLSNIGLAGSRLQQNEIRLSGIQRDLISTKDLLVQIADGSQSSQDINAAAGTLRALLGSLETAANARDSDGNYMFSGTLTSTAPINRDDTLAAGARYSYAGNQGQQFVNIAIGVSEPINVPISDLVDSLNRLDLAIEHAADPNVQPSDPTTQAAFRNALDTVTNGIDQIAARIASIGYAGKSFDRFEAHHNDMLTAFGQASQSVDGFDYAEAFESLSRYMMATQGSYQIYGRLMQLNPFDMLR